VLPLGKDLVSDPVRLPESHTGQKNDSEAARHKVTVLREAAIANPARAIQTALEDPPSLHALILLAAQERPAYEAFLFALRQAGAKTRDIDALGRAVKEGQCTHKKEERKVRRAQAEQQRAAQDQVLGLPSIDAGNRDLPQVASEAWQALIKANVPPVLFRHGGLPTRIEMDDKEQPFARTITEDRLRYRLARVTRWFQETETGGYQDALPPLHVVKDMLARPDPHSLFWNVL
jgi:hypothetical protein